MNEEFQRALRDFFEQAGVPVPEADAVGVRCFTVNGVTLKLVTGAEDADLESQVGSFAGVADLCAEGAFAAWLDGFVRTVRDWRRYIADLTSDGVIDAIEVAYRGLKRKFHAVDFDDLVNEYLRFVKRRPGVASFKAYVRSGGFPGYFATNEKEVLRELVGDILCQHGRR